MLLGPKPQFSSEKERKLAQIELWLGFALLIAGFVIGVYGHMVWVMLAVMLIGASFENLSYIRGIPKETRSYVAWGMRGGILIPIARGLEYLFGIKD